MANYTCLLLDVDNTLLDFNAAERAAVGITLEHYGMPNGPEALETYHQINRQLWDSLAKGELNRSKLFAVRFGRVMQALGTPEAGNAREMNDFYENELANHADLMPGALTALEELGEVATLAIVSNGATRYRNPALRHPALAALWMVCISRKKWVRQSLRPSCWTMPSGTWG